nr:autotransporter-associated beta strand repeat-containing protein [Bradyrhizobium betae]
MQQFRQSWAALRRVLLAGLPFAGVLMAGIAGHSGQAFAACTVSGSLSGGPNAVSCNTTVTLPTMNDDATSTSSTDYHQRFNSGGTVTGAINAGQTVSGQGLWVESTESGAAINFTNNGAATGATNGLQIRSTGGDITYSGNGSATGGAGSAGLLLGVFSGSGAITVGTSGTAIVPNFSGGFGLAAQASGPINIFLNGGSLSESDPNGVGMYMVASGSVSASLTGSTTITNASGGGGITAGIYALSTGGAVTITSNANIGSAGAPFVAGIQVQAGGPGGTSVSQTGGAIFAVNYGVFSSSNGSGATSINTSAGSSITMSGATSTAVWALSTGTGAANITTAGTISGAVYGVDAYIANAANASDVNIAVNGNVSASSIGVVGRTAGTGNVHVSVGSGVTVTGTGGAGLTLDGFGVNTVANDGTIAGAYGVATFGGTTTITNSGNITGSSVAVNLTGADNVFVMNGPNATMTGAAVGSGTDTFRFAGTGSNSFDVSQIAAGWTLLDKTGSSIWSLTGTSTYAGPVTVNGGTLAVNGDLSSASSLTVNAGGTLGGNGILGSVAINGGTLAPGNSIGTLTMASLTMTAASTYLVEVSPASADRVDVTGSATLGGATVRAVFAPGSYVAKQYTILHAGSLIGTFAGPVNTSRPASSPASARTPTTSISISRSASARLAGSTPTSRTSRTR